MHLFWPGSSDRRSEPDTSCYHQACEQHSEDSIYHGGVYPLHCVTSKGNVNPSAVAAEKGVSSQPPPTHTIVCAAVVGLVVHTKLAHTHTLPGLGSHPALSTHAELIWKLRSSRWTQHRSGSSVFSQAPVVLDCPAGDDVRTTHTCAVRYLSK